MVAGYTSPVVLFAPISIRVGYRYINCQGDDVYVADGADDDIKGFEVAASGATGATASISAQVTATRSTPSWQMKTATQILT